MTHKRRVELRRKLAILADAAKYDASCASSGTRRKTPQGGLGNGEGMGICHSYTPDGRCVSLLKILLTNECVFDCQYCINRASSGVEGRRDEAREADRYDLGHCNASEHGINVHTHRTMRQTASRIDLCTGDTGCAASLEK